MIKFFIYIAFWFLCSSKYLISKEIISELNVEKVVVGDVDEVKFESWVECVNKFKLHHICDLNICDQWLSVRSETSDRRRLVIFQYSNKGMKLMSKSMIMTDFNGQNMSGYKLAGSSKYRIVKNGDDIAYINNIIINDNKISKIKIHFRDKSSCVAVDLRSAE